MIFNFEQRSDEWFEVRRGKFTGSKFYNLMSKDTTSSYQNLINEVVYERLTNKTLESYQSADMLRGTELEPEAREDYEFVTGNKVEEVGFVSLDEWVGVSPDGLISDDGMIEIKCPKATTQIEYLFKNKLPSIYKWQVQGSLWVLDREWCDFYSYHPDLNHFLLRVERDEKMITELKEKIEESKQIVINKLKRLSNV